MEDGFGNSGIGISTNNEGDEFGIDGRLNRSDKVENALRLIQKLQTKLQGIRNPEKSNLCGTYVVTLEKLKCLILKNRSNGAVEKCEKNLFDLIHKIEKLDANENLNELQYQNSNVDLTSENKTHSEFLNLTSMNTTNYSNKSNCMGSSQELFSDSEDPYAKRNLTKARVSQTIYSRRKPDKTCLSEKCNVSSTKNTDPVQFILQTAKKKANFEMNSTDEQSGHLPLDLPNNIRNLGNILHLSDEPLDERRNSFVESESSKEDGNSKEIERYEGNLKNAFYGHDTEDQSDQPNSYEASTCLVADENAESKEKRHELTDMLEKFMRSNNDDGNSSNSNSTTENDLKKDGVNERNKSSDISEVEVSPRNESSAKLLSGLCNLKLTPDKNRVDDVRKEGSCSARAKIRDQIGVFHKVGSMDKISPSLKQLKSDLKKPSSIIEKSRKSRSRSKSPIDSHRRSRSPRPLSGFDSHRFSNPRSGNGKYPERLEYNQRESNRPKYSNSDDHSPKLSNSIHLQGQKKSNKDEEHSSKSPKDGAHEKNGKSEKSKNDLRPYSNSNRCPESYDKRRPYSDQCGVQNCNRRSPSLREFNEHEHLNSYQNFIDSIGGDRETKKKEESYPKQENSNADGKETKITSDNTTEVKPTIKKSFKFKIDTNLTRGKPSFLVDNNDSLNIDPFGNKSESPKNIPVSPCMSDKSMDSGNKSSPRIADLPKIISPKDPRDIPKSPRGNSRLFLDDKKNSIGIGDSRVDDKMRSKSVSSPRIDDRMRSAMGNDPRIDDRTKNGRMIGPRVDDWMRSPGISDPRIDDRMRNIFINDPRFDDRIKNRLVSLRFDDWVSRNDDGMRNTRLINDPMKNLGIRSTRNDPRIEERRKIITPSDPRIQLKGDKFHFSEINPERGFLAKDPRLSKVLNVSHPPGFNVRPPIPFPLGVPDGFSNNNIMPVVPFEESSPLCNNSMMPPRFDKPVGLKPNEPKNYKEYREEKRKAVEAKKNVLSNNQKKNGDQNSIDRSANFKGIKSPPNKYKSWYKNQSKNTPFEKNTNSENIRETSKKPEEFCSPLNSIYTEKTDVKTGKGYGYQKPKKNNPFNLSKFTIPKKKNSSDPNKPSSESNESRRDSVNSSDGSQSNWNADNDDQTTNLPAESGQNHSQLVEEREEECWDPPDSPEKQIIGKESHEPRSSEKNCSNTDSLPCNEPLKTNFTSICDEEENWDDELIEIVETNTDVIEIIDSDDMDKMATPPRSAFQDNQISNEVGTSRKKSDSSDVVIIDDREKCTENLDVNIEKTNELTDPSNNSHVVSRVNELKSVELMDFQVTQRQFPQSDSENVYVNQFVSKNVKKTNKKRKRTNKRAKRFKKSNRVVQSVIKDLIDRNEPIFVENIKATSGEDDLLTSDSNLEDKRKMEQMLKLLSQFSHLADIIEKHKESAPTELLASVLLKIDPQTLIEAQKILLSPPVEDVSGKTFTTKNNVEMLEEPSPGKSKTKVKNAKNKGKDCASKKSEQENKNLLMNEEIPEQATCPPKRNRELERLHADIDKMKHTKNNIFTATGTRSCRLKPLNYTDRLSFTSKNNVKSVDKKIIEDSSSESDDLKIGIRRTRSIAEIDSDSDVNNEIVANKSVNVRSKTKKISVDSDVDNETENVRIKTKPVQSSSENKVKLPTARKKTKRVTEKKAFGSEEILKSKPCPRRVKLELFGSDYERFETSMVEPKPKPEIPESYVRIPKLPLTCDRSNFCFCQKNAEKALKTPIKIELGIRKICKKKKKMLLINKCDSEKSYPLKNKNCSELPVLNTRRKNNLRTKKNGDKNGKLINQENIQNSQSESIDEEKFGNVESKDDETDPKIVVSSDQVDHHPESASYPSENQSIDEDFENIEKLFVHCDGFEDPNLATIQVASIGAQIVESVMVYTCKTEWCQYTTDDVKQFYLHLKFLHREEICKTGCTMCGYPNELSKIVSLIEMAVHMIQRHMKPVPIENPPVPSSVLMVKSEPRDEVLKCQQLDNKSSTSFSPSITEVVSYAETIPKSPNVPKIRVRRLSGDILSGPTSNNINEIERLTTEQESEESRLTISSVQTIESIPNSPRIQISSTESLSNVNYGYSEKHSEETSNIEECNIDRGDCISEAVTPEEKRAMRLWKCAAENCFYSTNFQKSFMSHLNTEHRTGNKRYKKHDPSCLTCIYCKEKFKTPEMLMLHFRKYLDCIFQCAYCPYRAYKPILLTWHQENHHQSESKKILVSNLKDVARRNGQNSHNSEVVSNLSNSENESLPSLGELVLPFRCIHCNAYETYSLQEYIDHWKSNHSQTNSWNCHLCANVSLKLDLHVKHLKLHGFGEYQCIYCLTGAPSEEVMKIHLMQQHRTLSPKIVKRRDHLEDAGANGLNDYIEYVDLNEPFTNFSKYFKIVNNSDSSEFNEFSDSLSSNAYVLNENMEYEEATDLNQNKNKTNDANGSGLRLNNDIIALDSDDDDNSNKLVICENEIPQTTGFNTSNTSRSRNTTISGLSGYDLYKCGFSGCIATMEDYASFKEHLPTCDNARDSSNIKCPHCNRCFVKNSKFLAHILLHGAPRYLCTLCDMKYTTSKKAEDHMKQTHKVTYCKIIPANPLKHDAHSDLFIITPDTEKNAKGCGPVKTKKTFDTKFTSSIFIIKSKEKDADFTAKHITTVYSSEDVAKYLPMQLFSEPVTCGLCSKYNSKVRSNILAHLKCHSMGLAAEKDITNPVPCMEKSELMFNKMTNHAAFSAKNEDKRIKTLIEKLEPYSGDKNELIPHFVPKTLRYSCCAPGCGYLSTDASRLKDHWDTLHPDLNFNCPHCGVIIPAEKLHTHLKFHDGRLYKCLYCSKVHYQRQVLEKHQADNHSDQPSSIQIIRELSLDEIEELNREARFQFDPSFDKDIAKFVKVSRWKCNLCRCAPMTSEQAVRNHCASCHRVHQRYKCCLCNFADDDRNIVNTHMNENHESISQFITVYMVMEGNDESLTDDSARSSPSKNPKSSENSNFSSNSSSIKFVENQNQDLNFINNQNLESRVNEDSPIECNADTTHVLPLPDNHYKCSFCDDFNTSNRDKMIEHLYKEKNYARYVCMVCGELSCSKEELIAHSQTSHGKDEADKIIGDGDFEKISMLTVDGNVEKEIEDFLNYQESKFDQVTKEAKARTVIISDSSDDELKDGSSAGSSLRSKNLIRFSATGPEYLCKDCDKVCSSKSGLTNHWNSVHKKKLSKLGTSSVCIKKRKLSTISNLSKTLKPTLVQDKTVPCFVKGVYRCSFCQKEFNSIEVATEHMNVCVEIDKKPSTSKNIEQKTLASNSLLECHYCNKRFPPQSAIQHISTCPFKQVNRLTNETDSGANISIRKKCVHCDYVGDEISLTKHVKEIHQILECLSCDKVFTGIDELERHVKLSYISRFTVEGEPIIGVECISKVKDVVLACPYCPWGLFGQTYDKYLLVSKHIKSDHPNSAGKPSDIIVKINDIKRNLLETEVALMQNKFTKEQLKPTTMLPKSVKKRNVALKSTSKISSSSIEAKRIKSPPCKKIKLKEESESSNENKLSKSSTAKFVSIFEMKADDANEDGRSGVNDDIADMVEKCPLLISNDDDQHNNSSEDFDLTCNKF